MDNGVDFLRQTGKKEVVEGMGPVCGVLNQKIQVNSIVQPLLDHLQVAMD